MNFVACVGRTTKDIELRHTGSGTAVCNFSLAVNRQKKDDPADYISCIAWNKTAELLSQYVKKGHRIGITGRLQTGSYKNKDGYTIYTTDVVVESLEFLESKQQEQKQEQKASGASGAWQRAEYDEDLPFK